MSDERIRFSVRLELKYNPCASNAAIQARLLSRGLPLVLEQTIENIRNGRLESKRPAPKKKPASGKIADLPEETARAVRSWLMKSPQGATTQCIAEVTAKLGLAASAVTAAQVKSIRQTVLPTVLPRRPENLRSAGQTKPDTTARALAGSPPQSQIREEVRRFLADNPKGSITACVEAVRRRFGGPVALISATAVAAEYRRLLPPRKPAGTQHDRPRPQRSKEVRPSLSARVLPQPAPNPHRYKPPAPPVVIPTGCPACGMVPDRLGACRCG